MMMMLSNCNCLWPKLVWPVATGKSNARCGMVEKNVFEWAQQRTNGEKRVSARYERHQRIQVLQVWRFKVDSVPRFWCLTTKPNETTSHIVHPPDAWWCSITIPDCDVGESTLNSNHTKFVRRRNSFCLHLFASWACPRARGTRVCLLLEQIWLTLRAWPFNSNASQVYSPSMPVLDSPLGLHVGQAKPCHPKLEENQSWSCAWRMDKIHAWSKRHGSKYKGSNIVLDDWIKVYNKKKLELLVKNANYEMFSLFREWTWISRACVCL